ERVEESLLLRCRVHVVAETGRDESRDRERLHKFFVRAPLVPTRRAPHPARYLVQRSPRAAERIAVPHRRPDRVENPRLALSRTRFGIWRTELVVPPHKGLGSIGDSQQCSETWQLGRPRCRRIPWIEVGREQHPAFHVLRVKLRIEGC